MLLYWHIFFVFLGLLWKTHTADANFLTFDFNFSGTTSSTSSNSERCSTFQNISRNTYYCRRHCTGINQSGKNVFGTGSYSEGSQVCLAAVHDGIILPESEGQVEFESKENYQSEFQATIQNRITSYTLAGENFVSKSYYFTSEKYFPLEYDPNTPVTDTYMVYTTKNDQVSAQCIRDDGEELPESVLYNWNYKKNKKFKRESEGIICKSKGSMRNALICRAKFPFTDVKTAFLFKNDDCVGHRPTYFLNGNETQVLENIHCSSTKDHINITRLEDKQTFDGRPPVTIGSGYISLPGLYSIKSYNAAENSTSHFFVERTDVRKGYYGIHGQTPCQPCSENGLCHPLTGACMCNPGFYGTRCEKSCRLDRFGRNCDHTCKNPCPDKSFKQPGGFCQGFVICQPAPIGCMCMRGYEGKYCDQIITLKRPTTKEPPKLTFTPDGKLHIKTCPPEDHQCFDNLYGNYTLSLVVIIRGGSQVIAYDQEIAESGLTEFKIADIPAASNITVTLSTDSMKNFPIRFSGGRDVPEKETYKFIYPCQYSKPDTKAIREESSLLVQFSLPKEAIDRNLICEATFKQDSEESTVRGKAQIDGSIAHIKFTFSEYATGNIGIITYNCSNDYGKCHKTTLKTFAPILMDDLFTYENSKISVQPFDLRSSNQTAITFFELELDKKKKWMKRKCEKTTGKRFNTIEKEPQVRSNRIHTYDFSNDVALKTETFYIGVLLAHKDPRTDDVECWKKVFNAQPSHMLRYLLYGFSTLGLLISFITTCAGLHLYRKGVLFRRKQDQAFPRKIKQVKPRKRKSLTTELKGKRLSAFSLRNGNSRQSIIPHEELKVDQDPDSQLESVIGGYINSVDLEMKYMEIPKVYEYIAATIGLQPENRRKNRYKNNLPYDETRVVLTQIPGKPSSDYINASYVQGLNPNRLYIACQGPKSENVNTIPDFWRMVRQTKTSAIVMIANFVEKGKNKVGVYFDRNAPMQFGNMSITVTEFFQKPHYIRSKIKVAGPKTVMFVDHYQFTEWPDHGVLSEADTVAVMIREMHFSNPRGTIVIHCSAGIGRTGTVILMLLLNDMIEVTSGKVNPIEMLELLRKSRPNMIENFRQFNFGMKILDEFLFGEKGAMSEKNAEEIICNAEIQDLLFQQAMQVNVSHTFNRSSHSSIIGNNRHPAILPPDHNVVSFAQYGYEFYVNAVGIPLQNMPEYLITTEHPFPSNLEEFWLMLLLKQCNFMVLLNETPVDESHPELLCGGVSVNYGKIQVNVEFVRKTEYASIFMVTLFTEHFNHQFEAWQILGWNPNQTIPNDPYCVVNLADVILQNSHDVGSTVLCCEDGVTACGLLVGAVMMLDHLKINQTLNVYRTVVKLRRHRPQFLSSKDQYDLLLNMGLNYLQSYSTYGNFK